jgi:hypothetical protein
MDVYLMCKTARLITRNFSCFTLHSNMVSSVMSHFYGRASLHKRKSQNKSEYGRATHNITFFVWRQLHIRDATDWQGRWCSVVVERRSVDMYMSLALLISCDLGNLAHRYKSHLFSRTAISWRHSGDINRYWYEYVRVMYAHVAGWVGE